MKKLMLILLSVLLIIAGCDNAPKAPTGKLNIDVKTLESETGEATYVVSDANGTKVAEGNVDVSKFPVTLDLAVGEYKVDIAYGEETRSTNVEIEEGKESLAYLYTCGILEISFDSNRSDKFPVSIVNEAGDKIFDETVSAPFSKTFNLPAGDYILTYIAFDGKETEHISVEKEIISSKSKGWIFDDNTQKVTFEAKTNQGEATIGVAISSGTVETFKLDVPGSFVTYIAPGTYTATITYSDGTTESQPLELKEGGQAVTVSFGSNTTT